MSARVTMFAAAVALGVTSSAWATLIYPPTSVLDPTELEVVQQAVSDRGNRVVGLELLYRDGSIDEGDPTGIAADPGFVPGTSRSYGTSWDLAGRELYAIAVKTGRLWDIYVLGDEAQFTESAETYALHTTSPQAGISHVSFYGVISAMNAVPVADGGTTLVLQGLALCLCALVGTRLRRR